MAGSKEPGISWRHTSVIVRADIFAKAHEQGVDISNVCNTTLAGMLGVDYCQQHLDNVPVTRPVIIAQNGPPEKEQMPGAHAAAHAPVINADDPAASAHVRNARRQRKAKPTAKEPENVPPSIPAPDKAVTSPASSTAPAGKTKKPMGIKTKKDDGLKKFVATKIARSDMGDAVVSKDDMYQAFTRFCREQKLAPVPDRKAFTIALKNKFAFFDKTVNGTPSWVNIRLQ